uniref:DUF663 domain-containing protein n=1 Tax=Panagrellus redivivus TaxID=6233 RepID=A0A7E4UMM4_PANRE
MIIVGDGRAIGGVVDELLEKKGIVGGDAPVLVVHAIDDCDNGFVCARDSNDIEVGKLGVFAGIDDIRVETDKLWMAQVWKRHTLTLCGVHPLIGETLAVGGIRNVARTKMTQAIETSTTKRALKIEMVGWSLAQVDAFNAEDLVQVVPRALDEVVVKIVRVLDVQGSHDQGFCDPEKLIEATDLTKHMSMFYLPQIQPSQYRLFKQRDYEVHLKWYLEHPLIHSMTVLLMQLFLPKQNA